MRRTIDPDKLARYLTGVSSEEESAEILTWLQTDPAARLRLESVESDRPSVEDFIAATDIEHDPEHVTEPRTQPKILARSNSRSAQIRRLWSQPARAAAVVAAIAMVALIWYVVQKENPVPQEFLTYATQPGERLKLRLSDGTEIELNVDSQLQVPQDFGTVTRRVVLEGQAFFDVANNEVAPFVIEAPDASVRVVGTSFDLQAYQDDAPTSVIVTEGTVEVRPDRSVGDYVATLTPGLRGRITRDESRTGIIQVDSVDTSMQIGWRRGELRFVGEEMHVVAQTLSRWYNVDVDINDNSIRRLRLDASFENETLDYVLDTIGRVLDVRYTISGRTVTLEARP